MSKDPVSASPSRSRSTSATTTRAALHSPSRAVAKDSARSVTQSRWRRRPSRSRYPRGGDVEGQVGDVVGAGPPAAMGLHQFLDAGDDVAGVVEHGLGGAQGQVGQDHLAGEAGIIGQGLGGGGGDGGHAAAGTARHRDQRSPPRGRARGRAPGGQRSGDGADRLAVGGQGIEQRGSIEREGQHGRGTQGLPIDGPGAVVDHQSGGPGRFQAGQQVTIDGGEPAVEQGRREGPTAGQAGPQLPGREALHELDRQRADRGPARHLDEPRRPDVGQAGDDVAVGAHPPLLAADPRARLVVDVVAPSVLGGAWPASLSSPELAPDPLGGR